jgi:D-arabinose 1-dehydrogenase-like Zn-dependent alcohol dehydrogenase
MGSNKEFVDMVSFFQKYKLQPVISEVFSLLEAEKAIRKFDEPNQFGKIAMFNEL